MTIFNSRYLSSLHTHKFTELFLCKVFLFSRLLDGFAYEVGLQFGFHRISAWSTFFTYNTVKHFIVCVKFHFSHIPNCFYSYNILSLDIRHGQFLFPAFSGFS